ncbi:MAG: histidine kinase [Coriobacteriia bacterium]|nr:histidine kinase [Coriobacteriia bacterium]
MPNGEVQKIVRVVFSLEMFMAALAVGASLYMLFNVVVGDRSTMGLLIAGSIVALSLLCILWLRMDPDSVRARNTAKVLELASKTSQAIEGSPGFEGAQEVCELLLPSTAGIAVAITNRETVMGYAGYEEVHNPVNKPITTSTTHDVIEEGETRICATREEIGFPFKPRRIKAGIIVPLRRGREVTGTLKFYYRSALDVTEAQISMAEGFGRLLSTQMAAKAMEEQAQLATSMELKALQAQINPHFLFNTINTISSFIRIDPNKARTLLREFATFYRQSLEETGDLVALSREVEQTMRYFYFEEARFGSDRLCLQVGFDDDVEDMLVPAFMIQPLVENAVRHARPAEGMLTIQISAARRGTYLVLSVADDGVGMPEEQARKLEESASYSESSTGLGIAMKNVHDRVQGFFGPGSRMEIKSEQGKGTTITLYMNLESEKLRSFEQARKEQSKTASAEAISAAEVRSMAAVAEKSETTGVSEKIEQAISELADDDEDGAPEEDQPAETTVIWRKK